ncbi:addiction module antidote protein [Desulfolutivibrio sulfoxidireducens]|uniref:addiction module antidote protein n=1 Tax=Desulfolutivibrio sulfoxidireducens TaxID=2773299 RepID=UPI00159D3E18|nr:addiction module antidote protein [Desulfolutivibrio sulfoxidireducens]QLA18195.1 putative addiction module antidote protein [Desulfolutivibrio sulfoxidireducens]
MKNLDCASVSHDDVLVHELRADPASAAEYLRAAMDDTEEPAVLLLVLRNVFEPYGMADVARTSGLKRESLYRSLSPRGNPTLKTLTATLKAVGLRLAVVPGNSGQQSACAC